MGDFILGFLCRDIGTMVLELEREMWRDKQDCEEA